MFDRIAVKAQGKEAFKKNYWPSVAVAFIMSLLLGGTGGAVSNATSSVPDTTQVHYEVSGDLDAAIDAITPEQAVLIIGAIAGVLMTILAISSIIRIVLFNPITVGGNHFFKKNVRGESPTVGTIVDGFSPYAHVVVTMLLKDVFVALWSLLLIVPGVIKSYEYRLVPYLVKDHPELKPVEVLKLSSRMMQGNKWAAFVMDLSFLGWLILGIFTFNLGNIFWTFPYQDNADAALYEELCRQNA